MILYGHDQSSGRSLAGCWDNSLPGGFTVFNNKLYILGGFDTVTRRARDKPDLGVYS